MMRKTIMKMKTQKKRRNITDAAADITIIMRKVTTSMRSAIAMGQKQEQRMPLPPMQLKNTLAEEKTVHAVTNAHASPDLATVGRKAAAVEKNMNKREPFDSPFPKCMSTLKSVMPFV